MQLNRKQEMFVLAVAVVFLVLGVFAGLTISDRQPVTNDLNQDGEVNIQDFSIALSLVDSIKNQIRNY